MTQPPGQRITQLRALPVEVTPWLLETPESYFDRLCIANQIAPADLWLAMRRSESRLPLGVSPNYAGHALEVLGGIPIGRFDKSQMPSALASSRAKGQLQPRSLLCRRCARGEVVEIARHVGPICIRHRRWHDGGADLDLDGRASVLAAQRIINGALSQRGIAYRSPEGLIARELLVAWRELHPPSHAPSGEIDDFPIVARLMSRLSEPEFVRMLTHTKAGRQGHAAADRVGLHRHGGGIEQSRNDDRSARSRIDLVGETGPRGRANDPARTICRVPPAAHPDDPSTTAPASKRVRTHE